MDLYKDKKYVKLITETINRLTEGYEEGAFFERASGNTGKAKRIYLDKTLYNRVYNALITQPDKAFVERINNAIKNKLPIAQLAQQLKTKEDSLLSANKPLLGTEGHHIFHQKLAAFLKQEKSNVDVEETKQASQFTVYNRAWYYISKINLQDKKHLEAIMDFKADPFISSLEDAIKYFQGPISSEKVFVDGALQTKTNVF